VNAMDIRQIGPGMAKSFEDVNRGFRFRVVGDGKVESELLDRFSGQSALEGYDDPRLRAFATRQLAIAAEALDEVRTRQALENNLEVLLGDSWEISTYMSRGGAGVARVDLSLTQPGAGHQEVYLDNRDLACRLTTTVVQDAGRWSRGLRAVRMLGSGLNPPISNT